MVAQTCDLTATTSARQLHETLSQRAVEIVQRGMSAGWAADTRLSRLVSEGAPVDLGGGDVGRPLGEGPRGVHALAELARPDRYVFEGWDRMDMSVDACETQSVMLELTNTQENRRSKVEFVFVAGRLTSAKGWERTIEAGLFPQ